MFEPGKAVFLSYASQDAEAARRICDALRAAGVEVWFDQSELVGGDAWDQKIRRHIRDCALLIPIISAATQARTEGYFRLEWRLADQRTHLMAKGRPFLLPVVIDDTRDAEAHVPDSFLEVQWTRLPGGETSPAFATRVAKLLEGETGAAAGRALPSSHPSVSAEKSAPVRRPTSRAWLIPTLVVGVALASLVLWQRWRGNETAASPASAARVAPAGPLTEAQRLVAKARTILADGDEMDREAYKLAEELLKKAEALDPTDASAWALHATLSANLVWFAFDNTPPRLEAMRVQASRALTLAPDSEEAQLAALRVRIELDQDQAGSVRELQEIVRRSPDNWQAWRVLGVCLRKQGDADGAMAAMQRAWQLSSNDPMIASDLVNHLTNVGQFAEAERVIREQTPGRTPVRLLAHDLLMELYWRGNPQAATDKAGRWPSWFLVEDRGAGHAALAALWNRDSSLALKILARYPRDYLTDYLYTGPRAVLTAWANEQAGNEEAAQADWKIARQVAERILVELPDNREALYWKAWALARLGDRLGATAIVRLLEQREARDNGLFIFGGVAGLKAAVGDIEGAVDQLAKVRANLQSNIKPITKAFLTLNPVFDSLRENTRFEALVAAAPGPEDKKRFAPNLSPHTSSLSPAAAPAADKSVAVLAFANLSDDKGNEYFSDGISEELLNVLAKVPGLKVSARTSAFYFKGKEVPIPEIARQLGVAYVVEGSVRKSGDRVRITAQLIKAADGFHVWSDTFTRELKDIFAVQDEIAGLIAQNLQLKMGMVADRPTIDLEAYQEYLAGRAAAEAGTTISAREGIARFREAVRLDPKFTAAWLQIARTYVHLSRWGGLLTEGDWNEAALALNRAVALEPNSPDVWLALGWMRRTADWNWRGAEQALREALRQRPDHAETLVALGVLLANLGRLQEAITLAQRAVELDPLNGATQMDLLSIFFSCGRFEEAAQAGRRALQLVPGAQHYHGWLSLSLTELGRFAEAEAEAKLEPEPINRLLAQAMTLVRQNRLAEARERLKEIEAKAEILKGAENIYITIVYLSSRMGDMDKTFDALEKARAIRDPSIAWLRTDFFSGSRADPRYAHFLRKVGLADDQLK